MALTWTWRQFVQRIWKHINNDFPGTDFSITENEIILYITEAMASAIVGNMYNAAKISQSLEMPDAYIIQYTLPALTQDSISGYWATTLPQPPLSLPLGYSINRIYPAQSGYGQGKDVILIKPKRVGRRKTMPMQFGVRGWVTGSTLWLAASDGGSLLGYTFYAEMPITRPTSLTDVLNMPDDAQEMVFLKVIAKIKDRMGIPMDVVQDDLPAGKKEL